MNLPFTEILKSIPGFFGIRLEEEPRFETVDGVNVAVVDLNPEHASAVAVVAGALAGFDRGAVWPI